jgi:hypothetical protein
MIKHEWYPDNGQMWIREEIRVFYMNIIHMETERISFQVKWLVFGPSKISGTGSVKYS